MEFVSVHCNSHPPIAPTLNRSPTAPQQLRAGLPPQLKYIGLSQFHIEDRVVVIEQRFPMVRIARIDDDYYTVERVGGQLQLAEWPKGRTQYNARDWLECYGCEEAEWRDPTVSTGRSV
ncbi:hypothetical protein NUW54_g6639 [Trametes sanguinea]|uniref:Uncharacterized protein n=1 Tax=Trametes sanguinea TaxID=158606 RepID=A0ACC1PUF1_9APHY|nr:hypothetical protein NUW54_g6639 [Trametes sanguinea]